MSRWGTTFANLVPSQRPPLDLCLRPILATLAVALAAAWLALMGSAGGLAARPEETVRNLPAADAEPSLRGITLNSAAPTASTGRDDMAAISANFEVSQRNPGFVVNVTCGVFPGGAQGETAITTSNSGTILITPVAAGTVDIRCTAYQDGATVVSNTVSVTIPPYEPSLRGITLNSAAPTASTGRDGTAAISANFEVSQRNPGFVVNVTCGVFPGGTQGEFAITTGNSGTILITPVAAGTVDIRCTAYQDGGTVVSNTVSVTIPPYEPSLRGITLNSAAPTARTGRDGTAAILANFEVSQRNPGFVVNVTCGVFPGGTQGEFAITTGNSGTILITPVAAGTVVIRCTAYQDGGTVVSNTVSVTIPPYEPSLRGITLTSATPSTTGRDGTTAISANFEVSQRNPGFQVVVTCSVVPGGQQGEFAIFDKSTGSILLTPVAAGTVVVQCTASQDGDSVTSNAVSVTIPPYEPSLRGIALKSAAPTAPTGRDGTAAIWANFEVSQRNPGFEVVVTCWVDPGGQQGQLAIIDKNTGSILITPVAVGTVLVWCTASQDGTDVVSDSVSVTVPAYEPSLRGITLKSAAPTAPTGRDGTVAISANFEVSQRNPGFEVVVTCWVDPGGQQGQLAIIDKNTGSILITPVAVGTVLLWCSASQDGTDVVSDSVSVTVPPYEPSLRGITLTSATPSTTAADNTATVTARFDLSVRGPANAVSVSCNVAPGGQTGTTLLSSGVMSGTIAIPGVSPGRMSVACSATLDDTTLISNSQVVTVAELVIAPPTPPIIAIVGAYSESISNGGSFRSNADVVANFGTGVLRGRVQASGGLNNREFTCYNTDNPSQIYDRAYANERYAYTGTISATISSGGRISGSFTANGSTAGTTVRPYTDSRCTHLNKSGYTDSWSGSGTVSGSVNPDTGAYTITIRWTVGSITISGSFSGVGSVSR